MDGIKEQIMKERLIDSESVSITSCAVTIMALCIGSKQMTLSVFRQLPEIRLYRESGDLYDTDKWGLVRYKFNDIGVWVVCSHNKNLYRASLDHSYMSVKDANLLLAKAKEIFLDYLKWDSSDDKYKYDDLPNEYGFFEKCEWKHGFSELIKERVSSFEERLKTAIRYDNSKKELFKLPQLFIAI